MTIARAADPTRVAMALRPGRSCDARRPHSLRARKSGQSLVEMALIFPLVLLLLGVVYTGWDAMQITIGLTSAARAGAIVAANDLQNGKPAAQALKDATSAVNSEEGVSNLYRSGGGCTNTCVTLSQTTGTLSSGAGTPIGLVTITVTRLVSPDIPVVSGINLVSHASARYQ